MGEKQGRADPCSYRLGKTHPFHQEPHSWPGLLASWPPAVSWAVGRSTLPKSKFPSTPHLTHQSLSAGLLFLKGALIRALWVLTVKSGDVPWLAEGVGPRGLENPGPSSGSAL